MATLVINAQQQQITTKNFNTKPFDCNPVDSLGATYIQACVSGNLSAVKELLETHGVNKLSAAKDIMGFTGMHIACALNNEKLLALLIHYRIDVNGVNGVNLQQSPFQVACILKQMNIAKTLIFFNANIIVKDCFGKTGLEYLSREDAKSLEEYHKMMSPWNRRKSFITVAVENGYYPLSGVFSNHEQGANKLSTIETVISSIDLFRHIVSYI